MKKVYGKDVIEMLSRGNVIVLSGWDYPDDDCLPRVFYRSRYESDSPKITMENFPIIVPEVGGSDYYEDIDIWSRIEQAHVSTCETTGDFIARDSKYVVFSKEDVESWMETLKHILEGYT